MGQRGRHIDVRHVVAAAAVSGVIIAGGGVAVTTIGSGIENEFDPTSRFGAAVSEYAGFGSAAAQMQLEIAGARFVQVVVVPDQVQQGINSARAPIVLASMELDNGLYELGYEVPVRHDRAFSSEGTLSCQLVEATSGVALLPQDPTLARESAGEVDLDASFELGLPAMTIELRCAPETLALSRTEIGDVTLYAVGLE